MLYPRYPLSTPEARSFASLAAKAPDQQALTPGYLDLAYGLRSSDSDGEGVTIAVIEAYTNDAVAEDFARFGEHFGLPKGNLEVHRIDGGVRGYVSSWSLEASGDTQWAYAAAPAARILCVFVPDAQISSLFDGVDYALAHGADIVSMSWGVGEFGAQSAFSRKMKESGRIFVASAGDVGGAVYFPSSSEAVVSVGGAQLDRIGTCHDFFRSAWQHGGGGPSLYTPMPPYQKRFGNIGQLAGAYRATPDIAMDACTDPGYAVYNSDAGGFTAVCGTSISAPVFAGFCARLLQRNPAAFGGADHNVPVYLYQLAGKTEYDIPQYYFHDITVGSNGKYDALVGFDLCTGLGVPIGEQFLTGN